MKSSLKGYVNDAENGGVNFESMCSFLNINLSRLLGCKNQMFITGNTSFKNEHIDSTLTFSFSPLAYPLNDVMISRIHKAF